MQIFFHHFGWVDYTILAVVAISTIIGLIRGFIREILSLVTWVAAFVIAFKFSGNLAQLFSHYVKTSSLRLVLAFALLFIITLILGGLLSYLLSHVADKTGLTGTDRVLGMVFGIVRGILVIAVVMLLLSVEANGKMDWSQHSILAPHFQWLVHWLREFLPAKFTHFAKETSKVIISHSSS